MSALDSRGGRRLRKDTVRNRRRLLEAASELVREAPGEASMHAIAARAEIAPATAYRYFAGVEELFSAYQFDVLAELRAHSEAATGTGRALFEDVVREWIRLIGAHGPVMVQLRSRRGFLERLHAGDPVITEGSIAWDRPLRELLTELGLPEDLRFEARFLSNILFDPREVLDLTSEFDGDTEAVQRRLVGAFLGALHGWQDSTRD